VTALCSGPRMSGFVRVAVAVCAFCGIVLLGAAAAGSTPRAARAKTTVIARASKTGRHAEALATGHVFPGHYRKLAVVVAAKPNQRVTGTWSVTCLEPPGLSSRDGDIFKARTPATIFLRPLPSQARNANCTVVVTAKLTKAGRISVQLIGQ